MKQPSRSGSIAARLVWMNTLVSGIALFLAFVSFLTYNLITSRQAAIDSLNAEAHVIGNNSGSAIVNNDPAAAEAALSELSSSPDVVSAAIYTRSGHLFAQYPQNTGTPVQPQDLPAFSSLFTWKAAIDVLVGSPIVSGGQQVGTIYIQAHLSGVRRQAIHFAVITGIILILCLGVALLAGTAVRRLLSEPVVSFARTARLISRYRDYSLRFEPTKSYHELESLTDAFNEMLAEIQRRDAALEQARSELEQRVEVRTAQLRAANRELEAFSYTVAHDLRAPLETINNICYLLQNQDPDAPADDQKPMLERLSGSAAEMSDIIGDLLDLSRATSVGLHLRQLDLSAMACSILDNLATADPGRTVKTNVQMGCHANADKGLMHIVLQNLLRNAWKFTSRTASSRIEFGCMQDGPKSIYFVRDNGAGFDQRMADRLFKPFQRLHAESDFSGTGIGLATVQRIIQRHEGKVWTEAEVGKGATFYFTLGSPQT